jgi:hypothetical protein
LKQRGKEEKIAIPPFLHEVERELGREAKEISAFSQEKNRFANYVYVMKIAAFFIII